MNGVTTYFVGSYYEVTGSTVTKYYFAGSTRVAMRTDDDSTPGTTLDFLLSDHLGSTSLTLNASGSVISEMRYKPWGEVRYNAGTTPTEYTHTGQRSDSYINLLFYGARWYDPSLGRFVQADSIVPSGEKGVNVDLIVSYNEAAFLYQLNRRNTESLAELTGEKDSSRKQIGADAQGFDRFSYTNNNPIKYTDPTGHCLWDLCIVEIGVVSIGIVELAALVAGTTLMAYTYGPGGEQRVESFANSIVAVGEQVSEGLSASFAKGEYIPSGLSDAERWAYREAIHRYKKIWGLGAEDDVPEEIIDELGKLIKKGVDPRDAAEGVDGPPEEDEMLDIDEFRIFR
ncbi:MAG: RHS repeat-associated core domain-containing protein [Chloroflexi bacterium]|nr:RHS repeat-associated core domain-containing protein [Chloroflexota bacterium]